MKTKPRTAATLQAENQCHQGSGGVSENNRKHGFLPAFMDTETNVVALSCYRDGRPAALHLLEGLPRHWALTCNADGTITSIKNTIVSGFLRDGVFFTRAEARGLIDTAER